MKNTASGIMLVVIIASVVGGVWLYLQGPNDLLEQTSLPTTVPATPSPAAQVAGTNFSFDLPKKSAHYESNTPAHEAVLPGVPVAVVVDFNFDLAQNSSLSISREGEDYGVGPTKIDDNRLTLRREMDPDAPDGVYTVLYRACWPDRTCHDGFFQFAIDRTRAQSLTDWTDKTEVTVDLENIAFLPAGIRISQGTKVVWTNSDNMEHYINSDSHPAHTQFLALNSKVLKPGETFSYTFEKPGVYDYHCSAHAGVMVGQILVE